MLRKPFKVALATVLFVAVAPLTALADKVEFEAELTPDQEVQPSPVVSDGEGEAEMRLRRGQVRFSVKWDDLTSNVVAGHIHCAPAGVSGPIGVTLVHESPLDPRDRIRGSFTGPDAGNGCGWTTLGDVLAAIGAGNAYVNIHTENFPAGEIRGQLEVDDLAFQFGLDPEQEIQTPAVVSDGDGKAELVLRHDAVRYKVKWDDLTSNVVAGHIHALRDYTEVRIGDATLRQIVVGTAGAKQGAGAPRYGYVRLRFDGGVEPCFVEVPPPGWADSPNRPLSDELPNCTDP